MNRNTLAVVLAPSPIILTLLTGCVWVLISPTEVIDGIPDNAPKRAAVLLPMLIPVVIYPALLLSFALQLLVSKRMKTPKIIKHLFSAVLISILVSALLALRCYSHLQNNSFLASWGVSLLICVTAGVKM